MDTRVHLKIRNTILDFFSGFFVQRIFCNHHKLLFQATTTWYFLAEMNKIFYYRFDKEVLLCFSSQTFHIRNAEFSRSEHDLFKRLQFFFPVLTAMTCIFFLAFLQFQRWSLVVVNQSENEEKNNSWDFSFYMKIINHDDCT